VALVGHRPRCLLAEHLGLRGLQSPTPHTAVLAEARMPGARWFPGAQVNYAREVLRHVDAAHAAGMPAIVSDNELGEVRELSWPELRRQVAAALTLALGVQRGDRVAAYLPNVPETMVAFLACTSIGAIWSVCAPDMGTAAVADRFRQIEPKVLIAVDGVHYGGKPLDRSAVVQELRGQLPSVKKLLLVKTPFAASPVAPTSTGPKPPRATTPRSPPSNPSGCPSTIRSGSSTRAAPPACPSPSCTGRAASSDHARLRLHNDVGASYGANNFGERFHWYSSTGWVMWNSQLSGMAFGTTICIYDGNPAGSKEKPDWGVLWRFVAGTRRHLLRRRRRLLHQLHEGRRRRLGMRRSVARARARQHRLAAVRGGAALGQRSSSSPRAPRTSGGATSPAAPTSAAPSSAATASCPRCRARCSAASSAMRSRRGTSRASR
jgi:acetoacetyl-CoA synthetase